MSEDNCFTRIFLSKYSLIDSTTIDALISNGYKTKELLFLLNLNEDLKDIPDISMAQKSTLRRILTEFQKSYKEFDKSFGKKITEDLNELSISLAINIGSEPKSSTNCISQRDDSNPVSSGSSLPSVETTIDDNYLCIPSTSSQSLPLIPVICGQSQYSSDTCSQTPIPSTSGQSLPSRSIPTIRPSHPSLLSTRHESRPTQRQTMFSSRHRSIRRRNGSNKKFRHEVKTCEQSVGTRYVLKSSVVTTGSEEQMNGLKSLTVENSKDLKKTEVEDKSEETIDTTKSDEELKATKINELLISSVVSNDESLVKHEKTSEDFDDKNIDKSSANEQTFQISPQKTTNGNKRQKIVSNLLQCLFTGCDELFTNSEELRLHRLRHTLEKKSSESQLLDDETTEIESSDETDGSEGKSNLESNENLFNRLISNVEKNFALLKESIRSESQIQTSISIPSDHNSKTDEQNNDCEDKGQQNDDNLNIASNRVPAPKRYKCNVENCGKRFVYLKNFQIHQRIHTVPEKPYQCPITECGTGEKPYQCPIPECGKRYVKLTNYRIHQRIHTVPEKPYQCPITECGSTGEKPYQCPIPECGKRYVKLTNYRIHQRIHTVPEKPYQYPIPECGTGEKPYQCPIPECGKRFVKLANLRSHQRIHNREKPYLCSIAACSKRFARLDHFQAHHRIHVGEKPYQCSTTDQKVSLNANEDKTKQNISGNTVSAPKVYKCLFENCGKSFANMVYLKRHQHIHTGVKSYQCPIAECDKKFAQLINCQIHQRIHTGEKPYQCPTTSCEKRFAQLANIQAHNRIHTREKPYMCGICGQTFIQLSQLLCHKRIKHTKQRPYVCSVGNCRERYPQLSSLLSHQKRHK